jgi:hypothetical protein
MKNMEYFILIILLKYLEKYKKYRKIFQIKTIEYKVA